MIFTLLKYNVILTEKLEKIKPGIFSPIIIIQPSISSYALRSYW